MLKKSITYLLTGHRFGGIEQTSNKEGNAIHVTLLKKQKNELVLESNTESSSISDVAKVISKKIGFYLVINNEQVLTKSVKSDSKEPLKLVHTAFPNINLSDFIYVVCLQKETHFVSICRKLYVLELIEAYKKEHIHITNVTLGNLILSNVAQFVKNPQLFTSNARVTIAEDQIGAIDTSAHPENHVYDINGLEATSHSILSLTAALTTITGSSSVSNFSQETQQLQTEFRQASFFKQFLKFALIFIFTLLLVNFLIFNHYFSEVGMLKQTSQTNQESKNQILALSEKIEKSEQMVEDMLHNSSSKSSYFINDILRDIPETIQLTELNYHPILKRVKKEEPMAIDGNTIRVSGESTDSRSFSSWTQLLEQKSWIQKVEVVEYSDYSKAMSLFSILIKTAND